MMLLNFAENSPLVYGAFLTLAYVATILVAKVYAPKIRYVASELLWVGIMATSAVLGFMAPSTQFDDFWFRLAFCFIGWGLALCVRDLTKEIREYRK